MPDNTLLLEQTQLLISRLERLSADSVWAHRASGARGALLKSLEQIDQENGSLGEAEIKNLQAMIDWGFRLLESAAKEMIR